MNSGEILKNGKSETIPISKNIIRVMRNFLVSEKYLIIKRNNGFMLYNLARQDFVDCPWLSKVNNGEWELLSVSPSGNRILFRDIEKNILKVRKLE